MLEAYKIGAVLDIEDRVGAKLVGLSKQFLKVETQVAALEKQFRAIGSQTGGIRNASRYVNALDEAIKKTDQQARLLMRTFGRLSNFDDKAIDATHRLLEELNQSDGASGRLAGNLDRVMRFSPAMRELATATQQLSRGLRSSSTNAAFLAAQMQKLSGTHVPHVPVVPGYASAGGGRGGHGGIHGGNVHIGPGGVGMGGVGFGLAGALGGPGMAALGIGYGAYALGRASVDSAAEYQRQQARLALFGMTVEQNRQAEEFARTMNAPGASMIDRMKYMVEAQGVFRESGQSGSAALRGAEIAAPVLAQMNRASSLTGMDFTEAQQMNMLRFIEQRGGIRSPDEFQRISKLAYQLIVSSGGTVDFSNLRQFMRTSQSEGLAMKDSALLYAEPMIAELGGGPAGNAIATAWKRLTGTIRPPNAAFHEMERLGLWDASKVIENRQGGYKKLNGDPLRHGDEFTANPFKYYADYVLPKYDRLGMNQAQRTRENALLFGGTGGAMFDKFAAQWPTIKAGLPATQQAGDYQKANALLDKTFSGQMQNFEAAWSDFKTTFGTSMLPAITDMLKDGTVMLRTLGAADKNMRDEQQYVNGGGGLWGRVKRMWDWSPGKTDATVAAPTPNKHDFHITANIDGTPLHAKVASVIARKTFGGLGSGTYDLGLGMPSQYTGN